MRILLVVILIALFVWQGWPHLDAWLMSQGNKPIWSQEQLAQTHKRTVYILDRQRWTDFPIMPKQTLFRVLSNATVPRELSLDSELEWHYALRYQILDKDGKVLVERDYHHRTKVTVYQERYTAEKVRPAFYIDPNQQPTDGRFMLIHLSEIPNAALLRLRIHSTAPDVTDVGVRVYRRQRTDESRLAYLWHRLNERDKQGLARGNIYEHDLLSEPEKRNLLRERWAPVGPLGVAAREYLPKDIYLRRTKEITGDIIRPPVQSYGVFVDALHWITLPLLEEGGRVHLRFSEALPLPGQTPTKLPVKITIKWYGRRSKERAEHSFTWDGSENGFEQQFAGGLLEIRASQPAMMRVFLKKADAPVEITPAPLRLSATLIQKNLPVEFDINHSHGQATPVRLNLRAVLKGKMGQAQGLNGSNASKPLPLSIMPLFRSPCSVTYTLLNANGQSKKTGTLPITQSRSFYDRTTKQWWGQFEVSEADSYYLSIPANIVTLRLTSPCAVLVAVYNRPPGLLRKVRIPEDYYYSPDKGERLPTWFRIRPKDYEALSEQNRILRTMIQRRPPRDEENIEIMAGRYIWEDYRPVGKYRSRYILTPRDSQLPIREQALGAFYQEIFQNRPVTLQFVNLRRTIQPNLIYLRPQKKRARRRPTKIRILLDNRLHYEGYLTNSRGELRLPKLTARTHTLRLQVNGKAQFYINHAKPKDGQAIYIKRLIHRFDSQGLRFFYEKRSEDKELVSARVYLPQGIQDRIQVQVKLSAANFQGLAKLGGFSEKSDRITRPSFLKALSFSKTRSTLSTHSGWTFPQRFYDLRPAGEGQIMVLNTRHLFVDAGRFFVIPLQTDLPVGQYQIELTPKKTLGAYLTLSKITAGVEEQRKFFQQTQPYEMLF